MRHIVYDTMEWSIGKFGLGHDAVTEWKGRFGGCFCAADGETGMIHHVAIVGQILTEKAPKYVYLSQEKAMRLADHPDHSSSWQSRRPKKDEWGGAIRIGKLILSFSGMPELGDESIMLGVGYRIATINQLKRLVPPDLRNIQRLDVIAKTSKNPYWAATREVALRYQ